LRRLQMRFADQSAHRFANAEAALSVGWEGHNSRLSYEALEMAGGGKLEREDRGPSLHL